MESTICSCYLKGWKACCIICIQYAMYVCMYHIHKHYVVSEWSIDRLHHIYGGLLKKKIGDQCFQHSTRCLTVSLAHAETKRH